VPLKCSRTYTLNSRGPLSISLKLVVADRLDSVYDSWVFIQRGVGLKQSLQLTPPPSYYIGCSDPIPNATISGTAIANDPTSTIYYVDTLDPSCNSVTLRSWTAYKDDCFDSGFQYIYRGVTLKYPPSCGCLSDAGKASMFLNASSLCTVQQPSVSYIDTKFDPDGSFVRTWTVKQCNNLIGSHTQRFYNCTAPKYPITAPDSVTLACGSAVDIPYSISPSQAVYYPGLTVTTTGATGTHACGTSFTASLSATYCGVTVSKNVLVSIAQSNVSLSVSPSGSQTPVPSVTPSTSASTIPLIAVDVPTRRLRRTRARTPTPQVPQTHHPKPSIALARYDRIIPWFVFVVIVGLISFSVIF